MFIFLLAFDLDSYFIKFVFWPKIEDSVQSVCFCKTGSLIIFVINCILCNVCSHLMGVRSFVVLFVVFRSMSIWMHCQVKEGYEFESETDTEAVAKLLKHIYDLHKDNSPSFSELVAQVIQPLVSQTLGCYSNAHAYNDTIY